MSPRPAADAELLVSHGQPGSIEKDALETSTKLVVIPEAPPLEIPKDNSKTSLSSSDEELSIQPQDWRRMTTEEFRESREKAREAKAVKEKAKAEALAAAEAHAAAEAKVLSAVNSKAQGTFSFIRDKTETFVCVATTKLGITLTFALIGAIIASTLGTFLGACCGLATGLLLAIFSFGISIPLGIVFGLVLGAVSGTVIGGVSGAGLGYMALQNRTELAKFQEDPRSTIASLLERIGTKVIETATHLSASVKAMASGCTGRTEEKKAD